MQEWKALIVDDERPVRVAITKLCSWPAHHIGQVYEASNGREAMKMMHELRPAVVFLDMQMPVMKGDEFLRRSAQQFPGTAFIVVSGYDNFEYLQNAIRCGASDYLLKPVKGEELDRAVGSAMQRLHPEAFAGPGAPDAAVSGEEAVRILHRQIETEYSTPIRLADFADRYHFSKEYLSRQFKLRYGTGINEYLTEVRMQRARELLADPARKIQDIAQQVGYADQNYFSRAFRTWCGESPSEYRSRQ